MPQASPELRAEWKDDQDAIRYLRERGYVLRRDWSWRPPTIADDPASHAKAHRALEYLIWEWDFDGALTDDEHKDRRR